MIVGSAITLFLVYLVYLYQHPQPTEDQMHAQYNADKQAEYQSALDDVISSAGDECSTDLSSDKCGQEIQTCLKFPECLKMVQDYQQKNTITENNRHVFLQAVQDHTNQQRTQMGLPTLAAQ